jgi:hypothetical protein
LGQKHGGGTKGSGDLGETLSPGAVVVGSMVAHTTFEIFWLKLQSLRQALLCLASICMREPINRAQVLAHEMPVAVGSSGSSVGLGFNLSRTKHLSNVIMGVCPKCR